MAVAKAPPALAGLKVSVEPVKSVAHCHSRGEKFEDCKDAYRCTGEGESLAKAVRSQFVEEAGDAGVTVVPPSVPHDLVVKVTVDTTCFDLDTMMFTGTVTLVVDSDTDRVASVSLHAPPSNYLGNDMGWPMQDYARWAAPSLVNAMIGAPEIASYARSTHKPSKGAVADAELPAGAHAGSSLLLQNAVAAAPQPGAYALVIGIEHYRDLPPPTGARADAQRFAAMLKTTLGLADEHVRVALDDHATRLDIERNLDWLRASPSKGGRVYFFYSGHGAPNAGTGTPYLLPFDGDPKDVEATGVSLASVVKSLSETPAKEALAVVDSCFSGAGGRSLLPPGARPLVRVKDASPSAQVALFTASAGSEISGPLPGTAEGVFSHFVTEGVSTGQADANGDGQISLQELADWVKPRVARESRKDNREQNPALVVGDGIGEASNFVVAYGFRTR